MYLLGVEVNNEIMYLSGSSVCQSGGVKCYKSMPPPPPTRIHPWVSCRRGRGSSANHPPPHHDINPSTQHTQHSCKDTYTAARIPTYLHTTTHKRATTLVYIKLPMHLLFIWSLYLMVSNAPRYDVARIQTITYRAI